MAYRIPPMHCLVAFDAVARHGSVTLAAQELCVTASAVSHRIRLLEDSTGLRLFARGAGEFRLTDSGREYLDTVRPALAALSQFPAARPAWRQPLRVAAPPTFSRQLLVPVLHEFHSAYPETELLLQVSIPVTNIHSDEADVEIRFGDGNYQGLEVIQLLEEWVFPVCSQAFRAQHPALATPAGLGDVPLLRSPLEAWAPWFAAAGLDWPEPCEGSQFMDLGLLMEAAASSQGVALARHRLARAWLDSGVLVPLFGLRARAPNAYYLVYRQEMLARPEAASFIQWVQSAISAD